MIRKYRNSSKVIPESLVTKIVKETAEGLLHLHERKILHRDIKTYNIFLMKDKTVKIGDLGVSVQMSQKYLKGKTCGTPIYYPPEVFMRKPYGYKVNFL
jgi:NIMA (never in mitosis gene a)-related kinase